MSNSLIQTEALPGCSVYGVKQVQYTVDGVSGKDYTAALTAAAFKEAAAIETTVAGYAEVVRQRERKLEDLGQILAALNEAAATLKVKDKERSDPTNATTMLYDAYYLASKYGISLGWISFGSNTMQMNRDQVYKAQNNVQYAIDREDNDLKQDMVSLQSFISKRDNSFSTAAKLVKKATNSASSMIGNM
ncbi:MAG: hypothetical protein IKO55_08465 [Kiritimatiellae bacterium]|nr:hypothetical protein [Kiritimatiellia bacterium]